ncbi:MAG: hypothetical protein JWP89_220 [Schlesneria sp.]|nr:hypothetical protein [Schlesneria sp.]
MSAPEIPKSRVYVHDKCQAPTVVGDDAFEAMSDPMAAMIRTWCCTCNGFYPVAQYAWADTGEKLTDYYARHSANASQMDRFLCSRKFLLICAATGLLVGLAIALIGFRKNGNPPTLAVTASFGVGGLILFGAVKELWLGKMISRRVCGVRDPRMLT